LFHLKSLDEELQRRRYAGHINNCVAKFHKIASASKFIRNSSVLKANYKWLKLMYNSAVSGMVRGQGFCVKLKAHAKAWVAHYVRLTSLLGTVSTRGG
jgi:hypothetical protein